MDAAVVAAPPIVPFFKFQTDFVQDRNRLKIWVKSRQIGGSFTVSWEVLMDAAVTGDSWNMMSRTQRQAEKLLEKVTMHLRAMNRYAVEVIGSEPLADEADMGRRRIRLRNGATIEALPCDPDTTTGDTVNWAIDEFGLFSLSEKVFGVIKPSIMRGKRMIVISTPRGKKNKFHDLFSQVKQLGAASGWSLHVTTIEDAVADGYVPLDPQNNPLTFKEFKAQEVRDIGEELFNQEYMCLFGDNITALLNYMTIRRCERPDMPIMRSPESLASLKRDLYVGVDVGRRHDLTSIWVLSKTGDCLMTESLYVMKNAPFAEQERLLNEIMSCGWVAGCSIDEQGIGMQMTENLQQAFPGLVTGVSFTNTNKQEMSHRLKINMESGNFYMPKDDGIFDDFESIDRVITDSGLIRIAAPRSAFGHGDRFWSACLANHSAAKNKPYGIVMAVG